MNYLICTLLLLLSATFPFQGQAQADTTGQELVRLTRNQADCIGAYLIKGSVFGPVLSPEGFGNKIDIQGNELGDLYWFEREHNTVWYKIKIAYDTEMWFDIVPLNANDDFDFLLFEQTGPSFCDKMIRKQVLPVRTNISRNVTTIGGQTGLSPEAADEFVPSGPGDSYSKSIVVKRGQTYILVIDNPFRANEGHTIKLHYKDKPKKRIRDEHEQTPIKIKTAPLTVKIIDEKTGEAIEGDLKIDGGYNDERSSTSQSSFTFEAEVYKTYTINADKAGYMFGTIKQTMMRQEETEVVVKMRKIEAGAKVTLPEIQFEANLSIFLPSSKKSLNRLLVFMQANPDVKIEVQGHVNGPGQKNRKKFRALSAERAKQVFLYLWDAGIEKTRMSFAGYGNSMMVHTAPINEKQAESNRRVEIEIL
jgi:outer membrane protein OmpA-like peptidoglycan-associated protein